MTAAGNITAHNLVTGHQTTHIVNVYQAGGGTWGEAEYQAALERYLDMARCHQRAGGVTRHPLQWPASGGTVAPGRLRATRRHALPTA